MRYFTLSEFDSPDQVNSGEMMDSDFLAMLDEARDCAGIPLLFPEVGVFVQLLTIDS